MSTQIQPKGRVSQLLQTVLYTQSLYNLGKNNYSLVREFYRGKFQYRIYVSIEDIIVSEIVRRLVPTDVNQTRKSIQVQTYYSDSSAKVVPVPSDDLDIKCNIDGYTVHLTVEQTDKPTKKQSAPNVVRLRPDRMCFLVTSVTAARAVLEFLNECAEACRKGLQDIKMYVYDYDWRRLNYIPYRSVDNVILRAGQMERIVKDLETFLTSEDLYTQRAIPYHRGYLLYGPPGTGKTSIATALAHHFKKNVYYLSLNDIQKDTSLIECISSIAHNSVLVIEDIDISAAARDRETQDAAAPQHTLAGLLNALDGMSTPPGLVTVITTNYIDALDKALIRPGRIDLVEHIGYADQDQLVRLFANFYPGEHLPHDVQLQPGREISPARILECFKSNLTSPDQAVQAVRELLS